MELNPVHCSPQKYWEHLLKSISGANPELSARLTQFELPDTLSKLDRFLQFINAELSKVEPFLLVVDDFSVIKNSETERMVKSLARNLIKNLCIVVLSSTRTDVGFYCLKSGGTVFQINDEDLRFTAEEMQRLFALNNIFFTKDELAGIYEKTRGWPIALNLIVREAVHNPNFRKNLDTNLSLAFEIINNEHFSCYDGEMRKLFLKLSLLREFPVQMAVRFGKSSECVRGAVEANLFFRYNAITNKYAMHPMYQNFLHHRISGISKEERSAFLHRASEWLCKNGYAYDAVVCCFDNGLYGHMLTLANRFPQIFHDAGRTRKLMEYFRRIPDTLTENHRLAQYLQAISILLFENSPLKAEAILLRLEKELSENEDVRSRRILGEVYLALAELSKMKNTRDFLYLYEIAAHCLPDGSRFQLTDSLFLQDSILFCDSGSPDSLKNVEKAYREAIPSMNQALKGDYTGIDDLFSAERSFYTFDFSAAKTLAYQAIQKAKKSGRTEIIGYARYLLFRTALLTGNLEQVLEQIRIIGRELSEKADKMLFIQKECIESWLYTAMEDFGQIRLHQWMQEYENRFGKGYWGPIRLVYAHYLLYRERYDKLFAFIDYIEEYCSSHGFFIGRIYSRILKSVCSMKTGDPAGAMDSLWQAYRLAGPHGLITPFVDGAPAMRNIFAAAGKTEKYGFDKTWLNSIVLKHSSYSKRLNKMRTYYYGQNPQDGRSSRILLTKTETKVLCELAQGFTRDELADSLELSKNTISTHIKSIFNKLGAKNGAEAIHLAHIYGILKN